MLDLLIDLGWKSTLVAGLALLAGCGVRGLAASERVMVLRAGFAALLMLPLFALAMPALELALLPAPQAVSPAVPVMAAAPAGPLPEPSPVDWMPWLYGTGTGLVMLRLIAGLLTLRRWTRAATAPLETRWTEALAGPAARLRRPVRLLVSPQVPGPLSWGIAPAWLLIGPATETRIEQAEAVIAHEMAHVRRFDWPVLMAARIATALYWFNPLVWLLARTLAHQTELAADDDAMRHIEQTDYAQTLLTVASPVVPAAACGMTVSQSMLAGRIRRVLEAGQHRPASRLLGAALLIGAPAAAAPLAAMQFVPVALPADAVADHAVLPQPDLTDARRADRPVAAARAPIRAMEATRPSVAIARRASPRSPDRDSQGRKAAAEAAGRRTAEIPAAGGASALQTHMRHADGENRHADEQVSAVQAGNSPKRRGPGMDERREIALGLSNSAIEIRAEAARIETDIRKRDVSDEARSGTLAGARAMRAEADRLDTKARRLIFGR